MNAQVLSGKFSNDDGGGIENFKNAIVSIRKATNLLACHTFWCFNCLALSLLLFTNFGAAPMPRIRLQENLPAFYLLKEL